MFTGISWSDYFIVVAISLTVYYLLVGIRFYSTSVKNLLKGKDITGFPGSGNEAFPGLYTQQNTFIDAPDDTFQEVEELIQKLRDAIANASEKKYIRQEFLLYLQLIIGEYHNLKNSAFQSAIGEFIISECKRQGAITLSEEEIGLLWKDT